MGRRARPNALGNSTTNMKTPKTTAQKHNDRQDAIWERCKKLNPEKFTQPQAQPQHSAVNAPHSVPLTPYVREACNNYDKLRAHAERLSEALTFLTGCAERGLDQSATHDGLSNCKAIADARAALAAYEKDQQ